MAKIKKCKQCGNSFEVLRPLQFLCSPLCAAKYVSKKETAKRIKEMKQNLKDHSFYVQTLQTIFNTYIRLRDAKLGCISCGVDIKGSGHASHFFSVGAYPNLRFDEDNVSRSCEKCNIHLSGNLSNYSIRLQKKIGWERFESLHERSLKPLKLTIPELQEKIKYYKDKIREINEK